MDNIQITVRENEEKVVPFVWINGDETEVTLNAQMIGDGGVLQIVGIFLGTKENAITFNTSVTHKGKRTKSNTSLRGVFFDRASIRNDGLVRIEKNAKGSDGYFASKILLFDDAKGRSVPSLEIDENDLKAGHASTVGRPDEQQMFYLQSRGLSEKEAQRLIISGFFDPLLMLLPEEMRKSTQKKIVNELKQLH
ncbi:MAG TPA: SufD family Fe-S cluster assembly protein [Patescibacteria group bacterium]|nr:SufD family Fe-S cluster assembly protein [Patescibacteria group bacterium]